MLMFEMTQWITVFGVKQKKAHRNDELLKSGRRESNPRHQLGRLR